MARKDDGSDIAETAQTSTKRVKLTAFYSGKDSSLPPGSEVELDEAEADRLIDLGAAVAIAADAAAQAE